MELKLNVYNGGKIQKIYETDSFHLEYGTVIDLLNIVDLDEMKNSKDKSKQVQMILKLLPELNPLVKSVFPEMTDEEIRHTDVKEIIRFFTVVFHEASGMIHGISSQGNA